MEEIAASIDTGNLAKSDTERAVLENDSLRVTVMPALGGKIASIQLAASGEELLQRPLMPYMPRIPYMHFDDGDASGWDECLPSVAACELETPSGCVSVPDHGDFWQVAWEVTEQRERELTLSAEGFSLPLCFTKVIRLEDNRLHVAYSVKNSGTHEVAYIWSTHPLFAVEAGDRILLPPSVKEAVVEGSRGQRLGSHGTRHAWPHTQLADGKSCDLTVAGAILDCTGDKLFAVAPAEGWCALERTRLKQRIELHFDPLESPYLGLWLCYGGWPDERAKRQQCVALEPCFAVGDSLAATASEGRARKIAPGGEDRWSIELRITRVS